MVSEEMVVDGNPIKQVTSLKYLGHEILIEQVVLSCTDLWDKPTNRLGIANSGKLSYIWKSTISICLKRKVFNCRTMEQQGTYTSEWSNDIKRIQINWINLAQGGPISSRERKWARWWWRTYRGLEILPKAIYLGWQTLLSTIIYCSKMSYLKEKIRMEHLDI